MILYACCTLHAQVQHTIKLPLHCRDFLSVSVKLTLTSYLLAKLCLQYAGDLHILLPNLMVHHYAVHRLHTPPFNI